MTNDRVFIRTCRLQSADHADNFRRIRRAPGGLNRDSLFPAFRRLELRAEMSFLDHFRHRVQHVEVGVLLEVFSPEGRAR